MSPVEQFKMLKTVYSDMLSAFRAGSLDTALTAVAPDLQEPYRALMLSLGSNVSTVIDQLGTVRGGAVSERFGELFVQRTTSQGEKGFLITLTRDGDGIWRINGM